jgi:hypothetical protein
MSAEGPKEVSGSRLDTAFNFGHERGKTQMQGLGCFTPFKKMP